MRDHLAELDRLDTPDDWQAIERRVPGPSPGNPRRGGKERLVTALVAIAIAAAAGSLLLRTVDRSRPGEPTPTPTALSEVPVTSGADGTLLYPETNPQAYPQLQRVADDHPGAGSTQVGTIAAQFVERILGWQQASIGIDRSHMADGWAVATVDGSKRGLQATVTLVQPVRHGDGGIWAVQSAATQGANVEVQPGDQVVVGSEVAGHIDVPSGDHPAWGYVIGDYSREPRCFASGGEIPDGVDFAITPQIRPDRVAGTECGTEVGGYLWVATAGFRLSPSSCGPMCGDSTPYGEVAIVPVLIQIPANAPQVGLSTYTDRSVNTGWKLDYPAGWNVDRRDGTVVVTNGMDGGGRVELTIAPVVTSLLDLADNDSSFPLDVSEFVPSDGQRMLQFQGNGVPYTAALTLGIDAALADAVKMNAVIASIRFPSIRDGDDSGPWHSLGSRGYPVGVGTPAFLSDSDLGYLVRAPHGVYALGPNIESCGEGENTTWDEAARQILFECPIGHDVRYELDGTPVAGNPPGYQQPLNVYRVITAWDGTFLVTLSQPINVDPHAYW